MYTIRQAESIDAELVADLSRDTFYETFAADNTAEDMEIFLSKQFTREGLIAEMDRTDLIFFLAYAEEEVVGYVKLRACRLPDSNDPSIEIARIYVKKEWVGKGAGQVLMQVSIDHAIQQNYKWLWLGVWEKNPRAIAFYEKWGFEKFGETDFFLGNDKQTDWLMKKQL
jgi:ribosomal protein S18 acetylase RimI-like enzyme